jgi:hypothetical protein
MNFTNIKKVCLKEIKESIHDEQFKQMILMFFIFPLFIIILSLLLSKGPISKGGIWGLYGIAFIYAIISLMVQDKFLNVILLNKFQALLTLPMSIKDIFIGKYLSIIILVSIYFIILNIILNLIFSCLHGRVDLNLISLILSVFLFIIFSIYFAICSLLLLKHKIKVIYTIFQLVPLSVFALLMGAFITLIQKMNSNSYQLLNFTESLKNLTYSFSNTSNVIVSNQIFWISIEGIILVGGIIILIMLSISIYLLNSLNKEKIMK